MAVCLDYQRVYCSRRESAVSIKMQLFAALLLLFALSAKVWIKINCTSVGYQLAKARQISVSQDMQLRELELELSLLMRPDRLAEEARRKLDLRQLDPGQAYRITY